MKSIDKLVAEHDNILTLTQVINSACIKLFLHNEIEVSDWRKMIEFGRVYADQLHHQKEENILFLEMTATLGTPAEKLIQNGMLVEHDLGRLYVRQLDEALTLLDKFPDNTQAKIDIIGNAVAYRNLLERHIDKENSVVFTFASNNLSSESADKVELLTAEHEAQLKIIQLEKEQLANLHQLTAKYL